MTLVGAVLAGVMAGSAGAQDTAVVIRHVLALDALRVQPFRRTYDVLVQDADSVRVISQRQVSLEAARYDGADAWLLVESRTGTVASAESLYVALDVRPLHWSSTLGPARLAAEFVGDSILGAAIVARSRQNLALAGKPDLLVTAAMVEAILGLLPLDSAWSDSASVLSVTVAQGFVRPAELRVVAQGDLPVDSSTVRPTWVVALSAEGREILYWVDRETRAVLRAQQRVAAHVGSLLEYRLRPDTPALAPLQ